MSLMDESFPTDELFDELNNTRASCLQRQNSICHDPTARSTATTSTADAATNEHFQSSSSNETPFLNSDCSEETCASDPVGFEHDREHNETKNDLGDKTGPRSSKAVSYQDIHSAYTKRRYKHVTSKVAKYIAEMEGLGRKTVGGGRETGGQAQVQRHRSMPETLTPRDDDRDRDRDQLRLQQEEESMSLANSSDANMAQARDESYERLINEKNFLQSKNNLLESSLYRKIDENILLRKDIDAMRNEFSEFKDKLNQHSLHSLMYHPFVVTNNAVTTMAAAATQTDLLDNLSDITYDSRDGSIEIPLLSVQPKIRHSNMNNAMTKPLSLNFTNDSVEDDGNLIAHSDANGNLLQGGGSASYRRINGNTTTTTTNNSGSSQPSSNDSAIDIVVRSEQPRPRFDTITFGPAGNWSQRQAIICLDRHSNRLIDLLPLQHPTSDFRVSNNMNCSTSTSSQLFVCGQNCTTNTLVRRPKRSWTSRILRIFGPCARCEDSNQSLEANVMYTVGIPLLNDDSSRV